MVYLLLEYFICVALYKDSIELPSRTIKYGHTSSSAESKLCPHEIQR
jgi:hypothetical protein